MERFRPVNLILSAALMSLWATALTSLTGVFGGVPLRSLRSRFGAWVYAVVSLATVLGLLYLKLTSLALVYLALTLAVGLLSELEERGFSLGTSVTGALGLTALTSGGLFAIWVGVVGPRWRDLVAAWVEQRLVTVKNMAPGLAIESQDVVNQMPSVFLIGLVFALFFALLFESKGLSIGKSVHLPRRRLLEFSLPELTIWLFLGGLGLGLINHGHEVLRVMGSNLLNVMVVAYFFQGLAVVAFGLEKLRLSWFARILLMLLILTQLFPLLCLVGLSDYWMNWRGRLARHWRRLEKSKENS